MTKADLVKQISKQTGLERADVRCVLDAFLGAVKQALIGGQAVYMRGFGSFLNKRRAPKLARNITKNTPLIVEAHERPTFKPSKSFIDRVRIASKRNLKA